MTDQSLDGADRAKAAIFDLDGTLVRGAAALPGAVAAVERLRERGLRIVFCTQDSVHAPAEIAERLRRLGFAAGPDDVVSTGWVAAEHLARQFRREPIYLVAGRELRANFAVHGCNIVGDDDAATARAVFVGRDPEFQPRQITAACRAIWGGARFFGSGRDRVLPSAGRDLPGAGGIIAAVEYATRRRATILGKPSRDMAAAVLRRTQTAPAETVVIGDQLDADIRLGKTAGCRTVLVLTGGTSADRARRIPARWRPDAVLADVGALPDWLAEASR